MPIRWGDMDTLGHVNNTVYFRFLEQARVEWLGLYGPELDTDPGYAVIVHTECSFLRELKWPGEVLVNIYAGALGRTSLVHHYELIRTDEPSRPVATGSAKIVFVHPDTGKSTPVPARYRNQID